MIPSEFGWTSRPMFACWIRRTSFLYRNGPPHRYYGGRAIKTPLLIRAPRVGEWHLVVDRGGYSGNVQVGVSVISE